MLRVAREEEGNTLIIVILVAMTIGMLASLALTSGDQANKTSSSERNHEQALGVAEAGVQQAIAQIEAQFLAGTVQPSQTTSPSISPPIAQGAYKTEWTRCPAKSGSPKFSTYQGWCTQLGVSSGYVIDAIGNTGPSQTNRKRHIRVSLIPPPLFPDPGGYALFSFTSISLKNNDTINQGATIPGNVWANTSIQMNNGVFVNGSVTSAQSWIDSSSATVQGNVWSGGINPGSAWAMNLGIVHGWAKASVTAPTDPQTCGGQAPGLYKVLGGTVDGDITTWGNTITSASSGLTHTNTCTAAAAAKPMPTFTYNRNNYDGATLHEFSSVAEFNAWVGQHSSDINSITGTFYIAEPHCTAGAGAPSPINCNAKSGNATPFRVDLSGWNISGDLTVVSEAPIYTADINDDALGSNHAVLTLVSRYHPPTGQACDYNDDWSECAVHAKNHLRASCFTSVLAYADQGPVAVKNTSNGGSDPTFCGSIISNGIILKNNQSIVYDPNLNRHIGFGPETFITGRWVELPS